MAGIECILLNGIFTTRIDGKLESFPYYNEETGMVDYHPALIHINMNKISRKEWFKNGHYYRDNDLPMIERAGGYKAWVNEKGAYHRLDGPAIIHCNGTEMYCINGKFHRTDGPAVFRKDERGYISKEEYFLNDKPVTKEEVMGKLEKQKVPTIPTIPTVSPQLTSTNGDWTSTDHIRFILSQTEMTSSEKKECILLYLNSDISKISQKDRITFILRAEGLTNTEKKEALMLLADKPLTSTV
jgi:hypothetical protein